MSTMQMYATATYKAESTDLATQWMFRTFCEVSEDYAAQLQWLKDPLGLRRATKIMQFPFAAASVGLRNKL